MQVIVSLSLLSLILPAAWIGSRLIARGWRGDDWTQLCLGIGLFSFTAVGTPAVLVSSAVLEGLGRGAFVACIGVGQIANAVTVTALYLFTLRVFRRDSRAARIGAAFGIAAYAIAAVAVAWMAASLEAGSHYPPALRSIIVLGALAAGGALGWAATESLLYYRMARRRVTLGLAEPLVANRFLLWGTGCVLATLMIVLIVTFIGAGFTFEAPALQLSTSFCTLGTGVSFYLAFSPPDRYESWLCARAAARRA